MLKLLKLVRKVIDSFRETQTVELSAKKVRLRIYRGARVEVVLVKADTQRIKLEIIGPNVTALAQNNELVVTCGGPRGRYVVKNTGDATAVGAGSSANSGISIGGSPLQAVDYHTAPDGRTVLYARRPVKTRVVVTVGDSHSYASEIVEA